MSIGDGYPRGPRVHYPVEVWDRAACDVLLEILDTEHAVTKREVEARASDRTWNASTWPHAIDPGHFTTAFTKLREDGVIESTTRPTRGGSSYTTWSRMPVRGLRGLIDDAAQRKRLLTARHNGWSQRGGNGLGLIGRAGENALDQALRHPDCPLQGPLGSTRTLLDVELLGEIDNHGYLVDLTDPSDPTAITVMFEVKNRRQHYYAADAAVLRFLANAAHLQHERPDRLIFPVFVCRRYQYTLWNHGKQHGYLPVTVANQLVLGDHELDQASLEEVRTGLGYSDLRLGDTPTNRHLGMARTSLRKYGRERAEQWRVSYRQFLVEDLDEIPPDDELAAD